MKGALNEVDIDAQIKLDIYNKFGCNIHQGVEAVNSQSYYTDTINEETLMHNLNSYLFFDLFNTILDHLRLAFEEFKQSLDY